MKILIVDDEVTIRRMMRLALEETDSVEEAEDGAAALAAIRARGPFDVVLVDQKMPGLTGIEVIREIHHAHPQTEAVMITAYASLALASEAFRAGARHFLCKPITPDVLRAAVHSAGLKRSGAPDTKPKPVATRETNSITLNGFTIETSHEPVKVHRDGSTEHLFTVTHALADWSKPVSVRLGPHAFHHAAADIPAGSRLAQLAARRALAEYLFREGLLPSGDRLQVDDLDAVHLADAQLEDSEI
jgi:CheY-like chemotaxis protein